MSYDPGDYQPASQGDATEILGHRYSGNVGIDAGTRIEWDHRVVIVCESHLKRRSLVTKYGTDKKRVRCPRCRRWAWLTVLELPPDEL